MISFNKVLSLVFLSSVFLSAHAQTTVPQVISTSQTWTASGSPYLVTQNILVKPGATVKVMPGTRIKASGNFRIIVEGGFEATGTKDSVILIDTVNFDFSKNSNGYNFTTNTGSAFRYCFFKGTGMGGTQTIALNETPLLVSNCRFYNTYYTIYGVYANTNPVKVRIEKSIFEGINFNYGYVIVPSGNKTELEMDECIVKNMYGLYLASTSTITRCYFYDWKAFSGFRIGNGIKKATFKCNTFRKFRNNIIEIMGPYSNSEIVMVSNTFDSADYHVDYMVYGEPCTKFVAKNNNFLQFNKNSIHVTGGMKPGYADTLVFTKNYWGTTSVNQIAAGIWDIVDDIAVQGLVDFANFQTSQIEDCIEDETEESFIGMSLGTRHWEIPGISISPNPAGDIVSIRSENRNLSSWRIYNVTGELVQQGDFTSGNPQLDVSRLGIGMYLLEVSEGEKISGRQKLLIRR